MAQSYAPFQFTPLREGRRDVEYVNYWQIIFQFTPLREGRHKCRWWNCLLCDISIHAPPRGATVTLLKSGGNCIFQFTPLREGRPAARNCPDLPAGFQFTPLREGRPRQMGTFTTTSAFQFTPLREGRLRGRIRLSSVLVFQFTPLREGRHARLAGRNRPHHFNSRPSARGDQTVAVPSRIR